MSGTSLDGIDGVLVDFADGPAPLRVLAHQHVAFDAVLRSELLALNRPGDERDPSGRARRQPAGAKLRRRRRIAARPHRLQPGPSRGGRLPRPDRAPSAGRVRRIGYTVQVNAPALLAELCGIDVVADFRSRDVAAGGQGAPLVPAFHRAVFGPVAARRPPCSTSGASPTCRRSAPTATTLGFDCGPANALLDLLVRRLHRPTVRSRQAPGRRSGRVDRPLLDALLAEPYFAQPPPKSTGRDLFNARLARGASGRRPVHVHASPPKTSRRRWPS